MQFINYFLASLISYSGLLIGVMLIKIAPEEQKSGQKYFISLGKALLLIIFILAVFYYKGILSYFFILIMMFLILLLAEFKKWGLFKKSAVIYSLLGILFFISSKNADLFIAESSLILLYGLPIASLIYSRKEINHYKIFLYNLGFIALSNILFFI